MSVKTQGILWDRSNPLTFYGNEQKLDDLLGRIWGEVVNDVATEKKTGNKWNAKFKAGFGKLMAFLGVGDISGELGTETSTEEVSRKVASIPFETKQRALADYLEARETIPYIDSYNGKCLLKTEGTPASEWPATPLDGKASGSYIGILLGLFTAIRESPSGG
ncbi:MAG: hypothetical protein PHI97_33290 [Desulfobulbus sp.]|nr:hypothetical protein [Desulfobulbus sp.]